MENDAIKLQSIFHFKDAAFDETSDRQERTFELSGFSRTFLPKFEVMDIHLSSEIFKPPEPM